MSSQKTEDGSEFLILGEKYIIGKFMGWGYGNGKDKYIIFEDEYGKKSEISPEEVLRKINKRLSI